MTDLRPGPARFLAAYAVALATLCLLDGLWLGWVARDFYRHELGALMADNVRIVPAALYYLLYPAVVVYLALTPIATSPVQATVRSAVLGLAAFGVYDLTNLALLRGYSLTMTAVDMAWGGLATAVAGTAAYRLVLKASS
jgi:uncharacterized membrane protein